MRNPRKLASIYKNKDFYEFQPLFVGMIGIANPNVPTLIFPADASNTQIGESAKIALSNSEILSMEEFQKLWSEQETMKRIADERYKRLSVTYGYKNKRDFLKDRSCCWLTLKNNQIEIAPTHHKALDEYSVRKDTGPYPLYVQDTISDEDLGRAIREGFTRCTSVFE